MKAQDIVVGGKYVPLRKSVGDSELYVHPMGEWAKAQAKGQPFLYAITKYWNTHTNSNIIVLSVENPKMVDYPISDGYAPEDLIPYTEYYPDEVFLKEIYAIVDENQRQDMEEKFPLIFKQTI